MSNGLNHITPEQKAHIDELALKKASPVNMNPKQYAYVLLGHGGEWPLEKIKVPNGCIVVVKAHSGDVTFHPDYNPNILNIIDEKNKSIILNPNANKPGLYNLLNDKGNHSVAIYNENDEINDMLFQPIGFHIPVSSWGYILNSGFLKIESKLPSLYHNIIEEIRGPAFSNIDGKWVLNTIKGKLKFKEGGFEGEIFEIWDFFVSNSMYEYYYTPKNIKDICDAYTYLANIKVNTHEEYYRIKDEFKDKYANIIRNPEGGSIFDHFCLSIKDKWKDKTKFSVKTDIEDALYNYTQTEFFTAILKILSIKLSTIFEDVINGLIKPGIFYNISCRATNHTKNTFLNNKLDALAVELDERGIEKFPKVHNIVAEKKSRIGEAEAHRKNQMRQVANKLKVKNNANEYNLTNAYKQYSKNSKNTNSYTYKKGRNGKWQRYKKGIFSLLNTKNVAKSPAQNQGLINTSENQKNYVKVNGKWKTRKWNTMAQKYVEENLYNTVYKNNSTRKNAKWTEMAQKNKNMKNTKEMMGLSKTGVDPAGNLLGN